MKIMMPDVRLPHVQVIVPEVLAQCTYRLETISPYQAEKTIRPRPGCVVQLV